MRQENTICNSFHSDSNVQIILNSQYIYVPFTLPATSSVSLNSPKKDIEYLFFNGLQVISYQSATSRNATVIWTCNNYAETYYVYLTEIALRTSRILKYLNE